MARPPPLQGKALIQALCDLDIPDTIKISPNGKQVLYSTQLAWGHKKTKDGFPTSKLWLAETSISLSSRQITAGVFKDSLPRWHPDGNSIAFISDRAEAGKKWAIYLWHLQNGIPAGESHAITDKENERPIFRFEFSPDGSQIAFISADEKTKEQKDRDEDGTDFQVWNDDWPYGRLRTIDLASKQVRCVTESAVFPNGLNRHVMDFAWSKDGDKIAIVTAETPDIESPFASGTELAILHLETQELQPVCPGPSSIGDLIWAPDDKLYWKGGLPDDKYCVGQAIYVALAAASSQPERYAFGIDDDVSRITLTGDRVVTSVLHGLSDRIYGSPEEVIFDIGAHIDAFDACHLKESNQFVIVVATSDVNRPVEVFSKVTSPSPDVVPLSNHGAIFRFQQFGSACHPLHHRSRDDKVDLDSLFLTPTGNAPSKPQPTVVLIHGGPTDRNAPRFDGYYHYWAPWLLAHGYSIILPNYRGSLGKGTSFASWSLGGIGTFDYEDVVCITNNAIEKKWADPERLMVGGLSQGGFLTYLSSVRNGSLYPWKFQAAIPLNGITDCETMALTSDLGGTLELELNAGRGPWNIPKTDTSLRQGSALYEFHEAVEKSKRTGEMIIPPC
ncbi:putative peptidase YuxL [Pseudocercospora fuligena]|uniref:Dipeptidyl-peptidase V n=1 Tax=Pseudocercospora fuligena TaxID=685502 RepID=A0A8H6RE04_9PEZI|nr:putative peptidase YuxL [Pseudocercospora fuligena]